MLTIMPNLVHPLFTAPAASVDAAMVRSFLDLEVEENFTVDYKRGFNDAPETVAAMANTYGGVVLVGVDARPQDKNLPGAVVGAKVIDKDRLVTKMATTLDPPWWTPEVIPVLLGDKLVLVVRVDADSAPRPLFYKGAVKIRLDGQNAIADRRLVQVMFTKSDDPAPVYVGEPRYAPSRQLSPFHRRGSRKAPDLMVRAAASRPLRRGASRLRLHGAAVEALAGSLSRPDTAEEWSPQQRLLDLIWRADRHGKVSPWSVDPEFGHGKFVRLWAGHGSLEQSPDTGVRLECTAQLAGSGSSLDVVFDVLFWLGGDKLASELLIASCREAAQALIEHALPATTQALLGSVTLPTPPVELHITPGETSDSLEPIPLEQLVNTGFLGPRSGTGPLRAGGEYLPEEPVAEGRLRDAVNEALRNIALDWRFLHPDIP
jgi:hypothetical protein